MTSCSGGLRSTTYDAENRRWESRTLCMPSQATKNRSASYSGTACRLGSPCSWASLSYGLRGLGAIYLFQVVRKASVGRRGLSPPLAEHNLDAYLAKAQ
jgi:hypothetical protein